MRRSRRAREFYSAETSARLLVPEPDVVIDAIDNVAGEDAPDRDLRARPAAHRVGDGRRRAARSDAGARRAICARRSVDPFARELRRNLRGSTASTARKHVGVWAVYSEEPPIAPHELAYDDGAFRCVCPGGENGVNDCEHKNRVEGSSRVRAVGVRHDDGVGRGEAARRRATLDSALPTSPS